MRLNLWKLRTSYCTVQWVRFFAFCRVLLDEHSSSVENINTNTYPTHGIPSSLFDFLQIFATLFCEIFIITVLLQWNNNVDCSSSVKRVLILKKNRRKCAITFLFFYRFLLGPGECHPESSREYVTTSPFAYCLTSAEIYLRRNKNLHVVYTRSQQVILISLVVFI